MKGDKQPTKGLLDYLDITLGRMSKSDADSPSKRRRSWSATVLFWCVMPAFVMLISTSFRTVYMTIYQPNNGVNKSASKARSSSSKTPSIIKIKLPTSAGPFDWPEVFLAAFVMLLGFVFAVMSSEQDMRRVERLGSIIGDVRNGKTKTSSETVTIIEKTLQDAVTRMIGSVHSESEIPASKKPNIGNGDAK